MRLIGLAGVLVLSQFLAPIAAETQPGGPGLTAATSGVPILVWRSLRLAPRSVIG